MAQANDNVIKVTYRIRGEIAASFHRFVTDRGLKKDKTVDKLLDALVHGRLRLPDGSNRTN